jgi:hypothetical protein
MTSIAYKPRTEEGGYLPRTGLRFSSSLSERSAPARHWIESLRNSDINALWAELHRIVRTNPLVRASRGADLLVEEGGTNTYTDLTQELFVQLLTKSRFQHYLDTGMTDAEIECEISQIELKNLLNSELRKRHPESYRLARRISTVMQSSSSFRRFDTNGRDEEQHRRLTNRVYGLSKWPDNKRSRGYHEMEQRTHMVPLRPRDTRMVGCTGDAQIVISNSDLEALIVSVLEAIDSPTEIRTLRNLVMSRLPVIDMCVVPLGSNDGDSNGRDYDPADLRENPEERLLRQGAEHDAAQCADEFLKRLRGNVRGKIKQYRRMLGVLWHCYLSPGRATQIEISARLGVSDSLISDYRRRIEQELRALSLTELEQARMFEIVLSERVRALIALREQNELN